MGILAFDSTLTNAGALPTLLYLPIPFFVWAALRFGPAVASTAFTLIAALVIWGAGHGQGPFVHAVAREDTLPIQVFLISVAVPVLFLAAVIQERQAAIQNLRISEELFATAFKSSPDAMAISRSVDGQVIDANDRWLQLLSYQSAGTGSPPLIPLLAHVADADRPKLLSAIADGSRCAIWSLACTTSAALLAGCSSQSRRSSCRASLAPSMSCATSPRSDAPNGKPGSKASSSPTSRRVASLTTFAGTLAHELTQPLTAILSNAQAALRFVGHDPVDIAEVRETLTDIADAGKRAGHVIHRLRLLMKKGETDSGIVDLNKLIADVMEFARGLFVTGEVAATVNLSSDLPQIAGDRVQLQQLLLNLISNACDALRHQDPAQRGITVSTSLTSDGSVQLVVSDTGSGIDATGLDLVFDPFYTTKEGYVRVR